MAKYDFTGLMENEVAQEGKKYDFSGLMESESEKPIMRRGIIEKAVDIGDLKQRSLAAESRVAGRGSHFGNIVRDFSAPGAFNKFRGGLGVAGTIPTLLEGGIANPVLEMQRGNFNPVELAREAYEGFTGKKQGQYGDVFKVAGAPNIAADVAGLGMSIALPLAVTQKITKSLGLISKWSDKKILAGGKNLDDAIVKAKSFVGKQVDDAFKVVDDVPVDGTQFIDDVSKLPKKLITELEEELGQNLEDIAQKLTIKQLRVVKRLIGKYKPTAFGKAERGVAENIDIMKINRVYSVLKKSIENSVKRIKGSKVAKSLMAAEDRFSEVSRASNYVKRTIYDSTLREPTKAGSLAQKMIKEGDVTARRALNILKKSGKGSRQNIDKAVSALEAFNWWRQAAETGSYLTRSAARALMIGGAMRGLSKTNLIEGPESSSGGGG